MLGFADGMLQKTDEVHGGNLSLLKLEETDKKKVESGSKVIPYMGKIFPSLAPLESMFKSPVTVGADFWSVQRGYLCRTVTRK